MPILVVIDIQKEYTTPGRDFYLHGIEESLTNAKLILDFARQNHWNIVHVQHFRNDPNSELWNAASIYSDFVEGFEPQEGELKVIKNKFSSYSALEFGPYVEANKDEPLYMIGYNTRMCCLSTVVEGFHRGHIYHVVADATLAKATAHFSEIDMHEHMLEVMDGVFAKIVKTEAILSGR